MKLTFPTQSKSHEETIRKIAEIATNAAKDKIAFVILFGSFARGDWIFDRYSEDNTIYTYASDYDFLVVTKEKTYKKNSRCEDKITKEVNEIFYSKYSHNPHFVIEPIDYVNSELEKGRYFFSDIKKEGILLYDSGEFKLSEPKFLSDEEIREIAREDYEHWFDKAEDFLNTFDLMFKNGKISTASFHLHQATEHFYNCALLVLTGYKPKSHNLCQLNKLSSAQSNQFLKIFPTATEEQKESFKLLNKAYIDARYNKHFKITKEQLEHLITKVEHLKKIVEELCKERI
jgi:HEPN domain-containing protein/predicted nucleotidyltransferase